MNRADNDARAQKARLDAKASALLSAMKPQGRINPIPNGTIICGRYQIIHHILGSDRRNLYMARLAGDAALHLCLECGYNQNKSSQDVCSQCHSKLGEQSLILSERWQGDYNTFKEFFEEGVFHPGIAQVYDVFEESRRLFTVLQYVKGGFLVDMGSPLSGKELVHITKSACSILDYLHEIGVGLATLTRDHLAFQEGELILHDPDIVTIYHQPTPESHRAIHLTALAKILREFVPADLPELRALFNEVVEDGLADSKELVDRIESLDFNSEGSLPFRAAAMSNVGRCRTLNEDNWSWSRLNDSISVFVVADGMGGHESGEVASEMAANTFIAGARKRLAESTTLDEDTLEALLDEAFLEANNTVKDFSESRYSDMGTTLIALMTVDNQVAWIANVGDSRAYLLRDGHLEQLTQDHSLVANLVAMGKITKAAARNHPHSNILVRTVGKEWDVEVDLFRQDIRPGDAILLCTDGLWGEVDDAEIAAIMNSTQDARSMCEQLIMKANNKGGRDNVTVLVIQVP